MLPQGGVRLLQKGDGELQNAYGKPVVGWGPTTQGDGGLCNPGAGFAMLRVVNRKPDKDGQLRDLYDQPMLVETLGSVVVPIWPGRTPRVGLIKSFRMVGERIVAAEPAYIMRLQQENRWEELLATLGAWRWEVPRGLPPAKIPEKFESDQDLALACARLEAVTEGGFILDELKVVGRVNTNPTFFPHAQFVVRGKIVSQQAQEPEDLEMIGPVRLFTASEIRAMVNGDKFDGCGFDDGITKAALGDAGFHY
jgi:hypothetical protein